MPKSTFLTKFGRVALRGAGVLFALAIISFLFHLVPDLSHDRNPFGPDSRTSDDEYWIILKATTWAILGALLGAIGLAMKLYAPTLRRAEADESARIAEEKRAANQAVQNEIDYKNRQHQLEISASEANRSAARQLDLLPTLLDAAAKNLNRAERDWNERVYNPFWTSVEGCAVNLLDFKTAVAAINSSASEYRKAVAMYDGQLPPFAVTSISVDAMNSYDSIYEQMNKLTRKALGDIDFANIFELWRGNAITEKGFANLRSAIQQMSSDISSQISSLSSSLDQLAVSVDAQADRMSSAISHQTVMNGLHQAEYSRSLQESRRHEKVVADRLWNIERGYKPLF
ncbi:hypothetical protein [Williamsia muralis]|uniref:hypothetical protein n=1 Tax=Williamsia marianensis TaxID=85044 RepID=UPI0037FBE5EF